MSFSTFAFRLLPTLLGTRRAVWLGQRLIAARNLAGLIPGIGVEQSLHTPCFGPTNALIIRYNGDIGPCCCDYYRRVNLGNILHQDILTIWRSPRFTQLRRELQRGVRTESICTNCNGSYV